MTVVSARTPELRGRTRPADTFGMESYARQQLERDQSWRILLAAYAELQSAETTSDELDASESDGPEQAGTSNWVARIDSVPEVKDEHLPRLHGRLIAFGLLKFQLASATTGIEYRVTPKGRQMLSSEPAVETDAETDADTDAAELPSAA